VFGARLAADKMLPDASMLALARDAAMRHGIDAALVCAVIEQESNWDTNAMRYEGAFRTRYVAPLGLPPTEEIARSISWGLMQVMGQVAREHGFAGKFLSRLCAPDSGVEMGCVVLADKIAKAQGQVGSADADGGGANSPSVQHANCMGACRTAALGCVTLSGAGASKGAADARGLTDAQIDDAGEMVVWRRALDLWNGGANADYAGQVLARLESYR
jgi:Transglycosylase SLT domain